MNEHSFIIHQIKGYIATLYLVEYPDRLLLLDGGARYDAGRIIAFIRNRLRRELRDLKLCLVSHMHPDHAGGAPILRRRFQVPIAAHPDGDLWYRGPSGALQHLLDTVLGHYSARRQFGHLERAWAPRFLAPDLHLRENDPVPGFPDWIALEAPGHTLFDLVFYHPGRRLLYVGDLIFRYGDRFLPPFPTNFPELMDSTLEKLSRLPLDRVLLAHGGSLAIDDPERFFSALRARLAEPLDDFRFRLVRPLCTLNPDARREKRRRRLQG
jgi:glyoxylase-like metal-dependent hydrolase (beta-lactamase superfamily II)